MKVTTFQKEERKEIKRAFDLVLDDMDSILQQFGNKKITIRVGHLSFGGLSQGDWKLSLSKYDFYLFNSDLDTNSYHLKILLPSFFNMNYFVASEIIQRYPGIRNKLIDSYQSFEHCRLASMADIKKISSQISSAVEIDLPPSLNRNELEITEQDGNNVVTINFGEQSVRIITNGEVDIVDQRKNVKVKSLKER